MASATLQLLLFHFPSVNDAPGRPFLRTFCALRHGFKVEALLERQCEIFEPGVATCVRYVISNQGKRMRPALVIFSAQAQDSLSSQSSEDDLLKLCAIIEMIHIATLVHDDIMDGARLRRNRPTATARWGQEISVLLGDCLFAHALALAASYPTPWICRIVEATNIVLRRNPSDPAPFLTAETDYLG